MVLRMSEPREQVFNEAAIEAAARVWVGPVFDKWLATDDDAGHHPVWYGAAMDDARDALAAAVDADPRLAAFLKLAALSDNELRFLVVHTLAANEGRSLHTQARSVLAALGLPVAEQTP
jgi:hypothetical protein